MYNKEIYNKERAFKLQPEELEGRSQVKSRREVRLRYFISMYEIEY
jgi:hypothetical protein